MKLIDYIESTDYLGKFSDKRIHYFESIVYMCEKHNLELEVGDGYELICVDINYQIDSKFIKDNPHSVWLYETWDKPIHFQFKKKKIVFCRACEENRIKMIESESPKKIKGRKSKKYKEQK